MSLNFKEVQTNTATALDEGWYTVKCVAANLTTAQSSGNAMIEAEFNIVSPEKYNKRKVWTNFALVPSSLWKLKTFLDAAKSKFADDGAADEQEVAKNMVGSVVDAYLEPDTTPTGNPRNNIRNFRMVPSGTAEVSEPKAGTKQNLFK